MVAVGSAMYTVRWDDEHGGGGAPIETVRPEYLVPTAKGAAAEGGALASGDAVMVYAHGKARALKATVTAVDDAPSFDVRLERGTRELRYRRATIIHIHRDGTYDLIYERRANEKRRKEQKRGVYRDEVKPDDVESGGNPFLAAHESAAVRHDPLDELGSRRRVGGGFP